MPKNKGKVSLFALLFEPRLRSGVNVGIIDDGLIRRRREVKTEEGERTRTIMRSES